MKAFHNFWRLPKPTEVGFSSDFLGIRAMKPLSGKECWEDYHALIKKRYPVKYFFLTYLRRQINRWKSICEDVIWDIIYRIHPPHQYHLLKLSQPFGYQRGWIDSNTQMVFANFNILVNFVEKECGGIENVEKELQYYTDNFSHYRRNYEFFRELTELYNYWKWEGIRYYQYCRPYEPYDEDKETEMLIRLIKIREGMWT